MRFVFLHGPGFNTFAERALLSEPLASAGANAIFWNEPSALRPDGDPFVPDDAFNGWLSSAEQTVLTAAADSRVVVIGHCVGALAAINIAARHPQQIDGVVLAAPSVRPWASLRNVMRTAAEDLEEDGHAAAAPLAQCAAQTTTLMDDAMREGLPLVLEDPRIFTHYWFDPARMAASLEAQAFPGARFDVDSFFAVMGGLAGAATALPTLPRSVPALAVFGAQDPIARQSDQHEALLRIAPEAEIASLRNASHFLYLDQPDAFVQTLISWAMRQRKGATA